jgi:hypothetical protein
MNLGVLRSKIRCEINSRRMKMKRETVQQIIMDDLGMRKMSTTDDQKCQLHISSELLYNAEIFDRVITGDEMWYF